MIENELQSVILGLKNHVQSVREESKKSLERLIKEVTFSGEKEHDIPPDVLLKSAKFSFIIYKEMKLTRDLDRIKLFLITLLSIGGRGPFFAWKFFAHGNINQNILIDIIRKFPVHLRLRFVYHYTLDDTSVRRYFGSMVKLLLKDITDRDTVISFLSYVYDQNALLDYVFDDLCIKLKIQEMVIQKELKDDNPEEKIKGIKAIGALGKITGYHSCVKLLLQDEHPGSIVDQYLDGCRIFGVRNQIKFSMDRFVTFDEKSGEHIYKVDTMKLHEKGRELGLSEEDIGQVLSILTEEFKAVSEAGDKKWRDILTYLRSTIVSCKGESYISRSIRCIKVIRAISR